MDKSCEMHEMGWNARKFRYSSSGITVFTNKVAIRRQIVGYSKTPRTHTILRRLLRPRRFPEQLALVGV